MRTDQKIADTRARKVYNSILDAIREGAYRPGDRLREEEVAQRLGVSRTPVREALGRLYEKGLVQPASGRGLAISVLTSEQVFELYAMRGELEALVAGFAAQHATAAEIANFDHLNSLFAAAQSASDAAGVNRRFHARLYDAARNRYLRDAVENLHETIALLPLTTFEKEGRATEAVAEHAAIIEAIRSRNPEAASSAARRHIENALSARLSLLTENN